MTDDEAELQSEKIWFFNVTKTIDRAMEFALDPVLPHAKPRPRYGNWMDLQTGEFTLAEVVRWLAGGSRTQGDSADVVKRMAGIEGDWPRHRWLEHRVLTPASSPDKKNFVLRAAPAYLDLLRHRQWDEKTDQEWAEGDPEDYAEVSQEARQAMEAEADPEYESVRFGTAWDEVSEDLLENLHRVVLEQDAELTQFKGRQQAELDEYAHGRVDSMVEAGTEHGEGAVAYLRWLLCRRPDWVEYVPFSWISGH